MDKTISPVTVIQSSGIILQILRVTPVMEFDSLYSESGLDYANFYMSIGYLVKEDRVVFYHDGDRVKIRLVGCGISVN
jgi:hypothetical protein